MYVNGASNELGNVKSRVPPMKMLTETILNRKKELSMLALFKHGDEITSSIITTEIYKPVFEDYAVVPKGSEIVLSKDSINIKLNSVHNISKGSILEFAQSAEHVIVNSVTHSSQTVTVTRGFSDTIPADISFLDNPSIHLIGQAVEEGSAPVDNYYTTMFNMTNYAQITRKDNTQTGTKKTIANKSNDPVFSDKEVRRGLSENYYYDVEETCIHSKMSQYYQNGMPLRRTSGLLEQAKYNGFIPPAGGVSPAWLDFLLYRTFRYTDKVHASSTPITLQGSPAFIGNVKRVIEDCPRYRTDVVNVVKEHGITSEVMHTPFGKILLVPNDSFASGYNSSEKALLIRPDTVVLHHLRQPFWLEKDNDGNLDRHTVSLIGEWLVQNTRPFTSAVIDGITGWTTSENYFDNADKLYINEGA